MVWVVSRFRLKRPSWYLIFIHISPLTSLGQRSRPSWASQPQKLATLSPQPEGKTTEFVRTGCGNGEKDNWMNYLKVIISEKKMDGGLCKTYPSLDRGLVPTLWGRVLRALWHIASKRGFVTFVTVLSRRGIVTII